MAFIAKRSLKFSPTSLLGMFEKPSNSLSTSTGMHKRIILSFLDMKE